jgi:hypothetical protein
MVLNCERRSAAVPRDLPLDGLSPADLAKLRIGDLNMERKMSEHMSGMVRHILTSIGGVLVMMGYTDEMTMATVVGAAMTLLGFAWSWMAK